MENPDARPTAFVTGASSGIGGAIAIGLARAGYNIAISATRIENLAPVIARLRGSGARVTPVALDLRSQESIEMAVATAIESFGKIDVLVNNAGLSLRKAALEVTQAQWDAVMQVNATGTFFISQQVGRHLIAGERAGSIISIASTHGIVGAAERSTYGISKAAIIHMTKMLAIEWAKHGIRVNAVAPGRVDTPSPSRAATLADPKYMAAMLDRIPLHRLTTPAEVAAAVCYLASPEAASVTGHTLVLDGGITAY